MKTTLSEEIYSPAHQPRLEVSLIYQDLSSGLRARQFLHAVLEDCQMQAEFSLDVWNLALFHVPEIQEQALTDTCKANLVLLSIRGDSPLEFETENWLSQWIDRRAEDECALAVLIGSDMQRLEMIGQTLCWLQEMTRPTHIRLFVGFMPPTPAREPSPPIQAPDPGDTLPSSERDASNRLNAHSEGGLNE